MASLPKELRKRLEKASKRARGVAEGGSRQVLESLAVHHYEPWKHLNTKQQELRNRLRAHGRQLGDVRDPQKKTQTISHLTVECAYEQWHRRLFARFLAENDLLIDPETQARVDLDLCRDLAEERGVEWIELASGFAVRMLPQIFRTDDPVLEIVLPPETRRELEEILESLPREIFLADDSLGWVYQFWQAERKKEINDSEVKIGADEISPVTQLFTEDYMVLFLLHNTLGAWWAGKVLAANPELAESASDEEEVRAACAAGDVEWTYLRFVREEGKPWRPAAGTFDGWPPQARDITVLDPCMGSGHFLVFALPILAALRMSEESLSKKEATLAVLRDNLHGLELDPRCTQIAAFNLALTTWKAIGYEPRMPRLRLACSGLTIAATEKEWIELVGADSPWAGTMAQLHALFKQAPILGSLIDPRRVFGALFESQFEEVRPALQKALATEHTSAEDDELAISAQGLLDAAALLTSCYTLVATNVPYLGRGKQDEPLRAYCEKRHPQAKADLATCFVERCRTFCDDGGTTAVVTPQNWLFLGTYRALRESLLRRDTWDFAIKLGPNAFQDMNWWAATTAFVVLSSQHPHENHVVHGLDVSAVKDQGSKAALLQGKESFNVVATIEASEQGALLRNPDARIVIGGDLSGPLLRDYADSFIGMHVGDNERFCFKFWEFPTISANHRPYQTGVLQTEPFGGRQHLLSWPDEGRVHFDNPKARVQGAPAWGKSAVSVRLMGRLPATVATGELFEQTVANIVPKDDAHLAALWHFCTSEEFRSHVRRLDQKVNVTSATLVKVPFDLQRWQQVASGKPEAISRPHSDDPTQWVFEGNPKRSTQPLQTAVARILGHRWPRQSGYEFPGCPALACDERSSFAADGIATLSPGGNLEAFADQLRMNVSDSPPGDDAPTTALRKTMGRQQSLGDWLRDTFFGEHCSLFHQRPFVWHIWDGLKDGFHVLVNYHKLAAPNGEGRATLEKLIHTTLTRDWIERLRHEAVSGVEGAQEKLAAAEHLRRELTKVLEGEPPYDLFIRWKPMHEQPIGWEPDINDGVRLNIRPFLAAKTFNGKSIFRVAPKIKWGKDRGKEPTRPKEDYPWFWNWDGRTEDFTGGATFDGNRWNDLHYTVAFKRAARERALRS